MHHSSSSLTVILLEHNSYIYPNIIFQAASSLGMKKSTAAAPLDCIVPAIQNPGHFAPLLLWEVQLHVPEETAPVFSMSPPRLGTTPTITGGAHITLEWWQTLGLSTESISSAGL